MDQKLKIFGIIIIIFYLCLKFKSKHNSKWIFIVCDIVAFLLYLINVLYITVLDRATLNEQTLRLIPGHSYYLILSTEWDNTGLYLVESIIGNILLFIPLGMFLMQFLRPKYRIWIIPFVAFFASFSIEIIQYQQQTGIFEIDDLLHNVWGAIIGCCIYKAIQQKEWKERLKTLIPLGAFLVLIGWSSYFSIVVTYLRRLIIF